MSKNNIVVRLKRNNVTLEVLAKPGTVKPYREGKMSMDKVLVAEEIFANASKFQKAKTSDLKKCCQSDNKNECLKIILDQGTFPLTKNEIKAMVDTKRREIINYLHQHYHDPTKDPVMPHPVTRMEATLETMRVKIDPHEPVKQQLKGIVKKLPDHLPVKPVNLPIEEDDYNRQGRREYNSGKKKGGRGRR